MVKTTTSSFQENKHQRFSKNSPKNNKKFGKHKQVAVKTKLSTHNSKRILKKQNKLLIHNFNSVDFRAEVLRQAKVLRVHPGTAELIADKVSEKVSTWIKTNPAPTKADFNQRVARELARYNADLAYLYQNRGKII